MKLAELTLKRGDDLLYQEMTELIIRVSDHMLEAYESLQKRVRAAMGGEVLELLNDRAERMEREAREEGLKRGLEQGIEQGKAQGIELGIEQGIEQGIERGIEQGLEKGKAQGAEQATNELSQKLAELGVDQAVIEKAVAAMRRDAAAGSDSE